HGVDAFAQARAGLVAQELAEMDAQLGQPVSARRVVGAGWGRPEVGRSCRHDAVRLQTGLELRRTRRREATRRHERVDKATRRFEAAVALLFYLDALQPDVSEALAREHGVVQDQLGQLLLLRLD